MMPDNDTAINNLPGESYMMVYEWQRTHGSKLVRSCSLAESSLWYGLAKYSIFVTQVKLRQSGPSMIDHNSSHDTKSNNFPK